MATGFNYWIWLCVKISTLVVCVKGLEWMRKKNKGYNTDSLWVIKINTIQWFLWIYRPLSELLRSLLVVLCWWTKHLWPLSISCSIWFHQPNSLDNRFLTFSTVPLTLLLDSMETPIHLAIERLIKNSLLRTADILFSISITLLTGRTQITHAFICINDIVNLLMGAGLE